MARVLIIGYGNPLRGDDGLGWRAAERLRERVDDGEIEILTVHQLTPELMEPLSRARRAIFIDACQGGEAGEIRERRVEESAQPERFTHHATPEGLLAGARQLFGDAPEAVMFTISGGSFELGEELTPVVAEAVERLVQTITASWLF